MEQRTQTLLDRYQGRTRSLMDAVLARIRQHQEEEWVTQEFRTVIARYGRSRQVQPSIPQPPLAMPVPEQPIRFQCNRR